MRGILRGACRSGIVAAAGLVAAGLLAGCGSSPGAARSGKTTSSGHPGSSAPTAKPVACGPWSVQTDSSSPATELAAQYGTVIECGFTGDTWLMVTAADTNPPAARASDPPPASALWLRPQTLLVYPCAVGDTTCLDPAAPHPTSGWRAVEAPTTGWVTLVGAPAPGALIFDVGSKQLWFDTRSQTWSARPSATQSACAALWSHAGGTSTAAAAVQDSFLAQHPQCAG